MTEQSLKIEITPDEMTAYLVWDPQEEQAVPEESAVISLMQAYGVKPPDLQQFLTMVQNLDSTPAKLLIALGTPPVNGVDSQVAYYFDVAKPCPRPQELPDGRMDYYNLQTIQIVQAGTLLAQKTLPTQGTPGFTVTGKILSAKDGKDVTLKGENTVLSEDGLSLSAAITGQVLLTKDKVMVFPYLEVDGDVDFSIGNIDFPGSVNIKGHVRGFEVKAAGNIEISGGIDLGSKISAGGDVNVRGGILAEVSAGGKVTARFAEHAVINAGESIYLTDAIMYGEVHAGKNIEVGGKGLLVGGQYVAGGDIITKVIGSQLATPTRLKAGVSAEVQKEYNEVSQALKEKTYEAESLQKNISVLKSMMMKGATLSLDRKVRLTAFLSQLRPLRDEIPGLTKRKEELDFIISQGTKGKIEAHEIIYTGVEIFIGNCFTRTLNEYRRATLEVEFGVIKIK